ncbi:MAG: 16S rRNA (cytosine(967)-C(5))-methyltransferase RsmB [bacterium]|nr:16S rRNA (cytosine(967)-C(5))-methyltransferase RsmB [bacterium]
MNISPARKAALAFLHGDAWFDSDDWDALIEEKISQHELDPRDRRLFSHLVSGVVRLQGRLDARIHRLTGREELDPAVQAALRLALYQLEEMDRQPPHAVVSESVEWVKRREHRLVAWTNAQLRNWQRRGIPGRDPDPEADPVGYGVDVLSYPRWLVERWLTRFGNERAISIMASMNRHEGVCFRWNSLRPGFAELLAALAEEGVEVIRPVGLPQAFRISGGWPQAIRPALERGDLSVQDEAAQRVAPLLLGGKKLPAGSLVDLCAAPGGKCCQLAELLGDKNPIIALDKSESRLKKLIESAERLGLNSLTTRVGDLLLCEPEPCAGVLLDAPCSALGVLASNPDARWRKAEEKIQELARIQRRLLTAATKWVKPGGRLVYSVCTISPEETGRQRFWFASEFPEFKLEKITASEQPEEFLLSTGDMLVLPDQGGGAGSYVMRFRREKA